MDEEVFDEYLEGDESNDFEDEDDDFPDTDHVKWLADGAVTLAEAATMLESHAAWWRKVAAAGFELEQPIDGGWVIFTHPEGKRLYEEKEPGTLVATVE